MISERIDQLVERIADQIAPQRMDNQALDLNALATSLGALKVVYRFTRVHGLTEWTRWGPVIVTSMARTDGRRRSTLAHECAHLLFDPVISPAGLARWGQENVQMFRTRSELLLGDDLQSAALLAISGGVESLCDRVAFELLFPLRRARLYANRSIGLDELCDLTNSIRVSLAVSVMALNRFDANLSLLRLAKTTDGAWMLADAVSPRNQWRLGHCLAAESAQVLEAINPAAHGAETLRLCFGPERSEIEVEVRRGKTTAIALIKAHPPQCFIARPKEASPPVVPSPYLPALA